MELSSSRSGARGKGGQYITYGGSIAAYSTVEIQRRYTRAMPRLNICADSVAPVRLQSSFYRVQHSNEACLASCEDFTIRAPFVRGNRPDDKSNHDGSDERTKPRSEGLCEDVPIALSYSFFAQRNKLHR